MSNTNTNTEAHSHTPVDAQFVPLNIAILTVSDTRDLSQDKSGQYIADNLTGSWASSARLPNLCR